MNLRDELTKVQMQVAVAWKPHLQMNVDIPLDIEELYEYRHEQSGVYIECKVIAVTDGFIRIQENLGDGFDRNIKSVDRTQFDIESQISILEYITNQ